MNIEDHIKKRIAEASNEASSYVQWLRKLRAPNFLLVGIGSLSSFFGGAAILSGASQTSATVAGILALVGGALTGFHGWLGCENHQAECKQLLAAFEGLKVRYEALLIEPDQAMKLERLRALDDDFAQVLKARQARPWKKLSLKNN